MNRLVLSSLLVAPLALSACKTSGAKDAVASAGSAVAGTASSIPSLVNVDLRNVLNDLSIDSDRVGVSIQVLDPP